jgi:tetratricopeptide (TPR) repeat protein
MSFQLDRGLFQFDFTDRHAILGVSVNAEELDIRERYQSIARLLHPDSGKWKTDADRQLAVRLFSRLVTHAYGQLSRSSQLQEQAIMLELLGKRLVEDNSQIQIADPLCQELYQSGNDFDRVYDRLLKQLNERQYLELAQSIEVVNQISELNMVYLLRKQLQSVRSTPPTASPNATSSNSNSAKEGTPAEIAKASSIEGALRRAEEYMSTKNWVKAVSEVREVISSEPNNVRAHTLLGLVYLRQQQMTMAKLSINKALQLAPKDPQVVQAKQEFDRATNPKPSNQGKAPAKKGGEGMFGGLFGKK